MVTPNPEQQAVIDAFVAGDDLAVEAGAGTGKTWTLDACTRAAPDRAAVYVAYSKALQVDASAKFPPHVTCKTAHALAYQACARPFSRRLRETRRMPAREGARLLGIAEPLVVMGREGSLVAKLSPVQIFRIAMAATGSFCQSAAPSLAPWCIQAPTGIDGDEERSAFAEAILPFARKAWDDLRDTEGVLPFSHDVYLKIWQLSGPRIPADVILFDEAQDANRAIADVIERQQDHAQVILVGDSCQQLFGWRGAVDAMARFVVDQRLLLAQSFRFGEAIAVEANKWLAQLDTPMRLRGNPAIASTLGQLVKPDAILCRTNAGAVAECMAEGRAGRRVALVGGDRQLRGLAEAAVTLKAGQGTEHPELCLFRTWGELQEYTEQDAAGSDLKVFVQLIDKHGPDLVIDTLDRLVDERFADVVVSTAHKSKGREWSTVRVASDFRAPGEDPDTGKRKPIPRADAMLAYVTCTRARQVLDRGGLDWIDDYMPDDTAPIPVQLNAREAVELVRNRTRV
jgi:hypothetical protein